MYSNAHPPHLRCVAALPCVIRITLLQTSKNMVFSDEDLMNEFPNFQTKNYDKSRVSRLLKKLRHTGTVNRLIGSGWPRSAALKKQLNRLTLYFSVKKICRRLTVTERSVKSHIKQALG